MIHDLIFTKVVATGNDFIIIDNANGELDPRGIDYSALARDICRRRISVGADGLLVLERSEKADFRMRVFNPDGSEVDMCGNGARCSCLYAARMGRGEDLSLETGAGILRAGVAGNKVKLKMSDPKDVRMDIKIGVGQNVMTVHHVDTGVPHVVHLVEDIENYDVKSAGKAIREHSLFQPGGANADFIKYEPGKQVLIRTYERGVEDETLACGTGNVAAAVILGLLDKTESPVKLLTRSGEHLKVYFKKAMGVVSEVYLEGPARMVCEGKIQSKLT